MTNERGKLTSSGLLVMSIVPMLLLTCVSAQSFTGNSNTMASDSVSYITLSVTSESKRLILGKVGSQHDGCYVAWTRSKISSGPIFVHYKTRSEPVTLYILSRNEELEWLYAPPAISCKPESFSYRNGPSSSETLNISSLTLSDTYTFLFVGEKRLGVILETGSVVTHSSVVSEVVANSVTMAMTSTDELAIIRDASDWIISFLAVCLLGLLAYRSICERSDSLKRSRE